MVERESDIASVRRRPGAYLGSVGPGGLGALVLEVVSNALDHVIIGRASRIEARFHPDGSVTVTDDGPGIPVTESPSGVSFLAEMLTTMHRTPTADGHAPHVHLSIGVGLGPVSAVCRSVVVETTTDGARYRQAFSQGRAVSSPQEVGPAGDVVGTSVRLLPDPEIFGDAAFDIPVLRDRLRTLAWLTPGLTVAVDGEAFGPADDLSELFHERFGPGWPVLHGSPFLLSGTQGASVASVALGWKDPCVQREFRSFCKFREMPEGGTHILGVEEGLRLVFGAAPMVDLMAGLVGVLHVTMLDPDVGGPTRGRLDSPEAIWLVADTIAGGLPAQLERSPGFAEALRRRVPGRPAGPP
ncbi:MAG: ATP-binding protein [Acidimicrobiales bacterium]